ncbi:transporter substrate-binding domain-containing protein [Bradyrhizobium sp.]|jgi:polar amino acid transport system substrate-binding protein|uniref:transporter substrate-binding domain-containing protein n=1 Tax=Bradyrhizobium sp. TaxID=376 RepID=UPI003C1C060F
MMRIALVTALAVAFGASGTSLAQQQPDPRVADLVQSGALRVGLGIGSLTTATRDPATGEVKGPALELGRALAARMGIQFVSVEYPRPGAVIDGLRAGAWDVSILIVDPVRAEQVDFSHPFMQTDLTYLVAAGSTIQNAGDADHQGIRIAVARGDTSDLYLTRALKQAQLVRTDSIAAAVELLRTGAVNAVALNRPSLIAQSAALPGSRVLNDGFADIYSAMAVPKGHDGRLAYINEFIEDAKASGLVRRMIETLGMQGVRAAAAAK